MHAPGTPPVEQKKYIHFNEVLQRVPLTKRALRRYIRERKFPQPDIRFSSINMVWDRVRLETWFAEQSRQAEQTAPAAEVTHAAAS